MNRYLEQEGEPIFGFHFVLSLGAVIAIFSGIIFNGEKIVGSKNLLPSSSSRNSLYHLGPNRLCSSMLLRNYISKLILIFHFYLWPIDLGLVRPSKVILSSLDDF